jgi:Flp pilus assembly protein CpaB
MATRSKATIKNRPTANFRGMLGGLLIGVGIASLAWYLGQNKKQVSATQDQQPIVAAYDMVEIPVPAQPVNAGTRVRDIAFKRISYPRHQVPNGAVVDLQGLSDSVTTAALPANLPLFSENFSHRPTGLNSVVERIPPGMRAMTIKVDATSSVEGWAGSGSIVDVLLIAHEQTSVIAEKVKVLSAERVVAPVEGAASPQVPSTVTLLVDQEQCLAINTAIPLGKIAFALRSPDDQDGWESAQYSADRFKGREGAVSNERQGVRGYFSVAGQKGSKSFALTEGKWIETEVVPEGFRVMNNKTKVVAEVEKAEYAKGQYKPDSGRAIEQSKR